MERIYKLVEDACPPKIKSLEIDRAALWVKWRNDGGWDVTAMGYFEGEWKDFKPLVRRRVRDWLGSFI
jgi:hypothetical protein